MRRVEVVKKQETINNTIYIVRWTYGAKSVETIEYCSLERAGTMA